MNLADSLWLIEKLAALFVIQQSAEQLFLNRDLKNKWRWSTLSKESLVLSDFLFSKIIPHPAFSCLRIAAALVLCFWPSCVLSLFLFLSSLLLLSRWRGNFNGGSDHMSLIVLGALSLAHLFPGSKMAAGAVLYVGLQSILSYAIGGFVKIKKSNWRQGRALPIFISLSNYESSGLADYLKEKKTLAMTLSWLGILFEISAPLALFLPVYLPVFLVAGFIFHLVNFYLFGLNRFVFVWMATYPAIAFASGFTSLQ